MFLIFDSYKLNQTNTYQNRINQIVAINKEFMNNNLQYINNEVKKTESLFLRIEYDLQNLEITEDFNALEIKEKLSNQYNLNNQQLSLEVFVLNKDYKVIKSSSIFDIGYDISINSNEKNTLDSMNKFNVLKQSPGVFFDAFDKIIKKYAFIKLKDSTYLGVSLNFELLKSHKEAFKNLVLSLHTKLNYRYVIRDTNNADYTMDFFMKKDDFYSRAVYFKNVYKNKARSLKDLNFIKASKKDELLSIKKDNSLFAYATVLKKDNKLLPFFADIVVEIEFDTSNEKIFFKKTSTHIIYFILMHFMLILLIFYFTTSYHKLEMNLKNAILKNQDLIKYNKNFIANMVHQIRTPLAVIMTNLSFLEYFNSDKNKYSHQINASITTLSNSYENLSYINSYETFVYKEKNINVSDFLKARVGYFDSTANASKMNLITNISDNILYTMNDIELERIIDNSITNAIKYSYFDEDTYITLKQNASDIILSFKNKGNAIQNEELLFQKKEKQEGLHLGLYTVNLIAKKYGIKILFKREKEFNIFEYQFKNTDIKEKT